MYEVIEKTQYGVLVINKTKNKPCDICKYKDIPYFENPCRNKCSGRVSYYLTDQESAKLETETDSQKEHIDLQIENKQLKERIATLEAEQHETLLDFMLELRFHYDIDSVIDITKHIQIIDEFIKNQK